MRVVSNLLWFIVCGWWQGLCWVLSGCVLFFTIILIPHGIQCFRLSKYIFFPYGKEVEYIKHPNLTADNITWVFVNIIPIILLSLMGAFLCCTLIGIPFGIQTFRNVKMSVMPFSAIVHKKGEVVDTTIEEGDKAKPAGVSENATETSCKTKAIDK